MEGRDRRGIPEFEAKRYEGKITEGNILISMHTENSAEIGQAKVIFQESGAQDICATGEAPMKESLAIERASRPDEAASRPFDSVHIGVRS